MPEITVVAMKVAMKVDRKKAMMQVMTLATMEHTDKNARINGTGA